MIGAYVAGALMPLANATRVDRVGVHAIVPAAIALLLPAVSTTALDRATPPPTA